MSWDSSWKLPPADIDMYYSDGSAGYGYRDWLLTLPASSLAIYASLLPGQLAVVGKSAVSQLVSHPAVSQLVSHPGDAVPGKVADHREKQHLLSRYNQYKPATAPSVAVSGGKKKKTRSKKRKQTKRKSRVN
jgi:hypothetical protein